MSVDDAEPERDERRARPDRRRYNRRSGDADVAPPYFAAFERIAQALEDIRDHLAQREVVLPAEPEEVRPPAPRGGRRS